MLQTFSRARGAAGSSSEEETTGAHVRGGPDEIGDALETEHGVINKKWNGVDAVRGIGRARGDEGSHGAGFGNSLFEDLTVFCFLVIQEGVHIDGLVTLADTRINSHGAEERLHTEGAGFIGNDRHYQLSDFRILRHFAQHADEGHGGGNLAAIAAGEKFIEEFVVIGGKGLGTHTALWNISAQGFAARANILNFIAVFRRAIKRNFDAVVVIEWNSEARAEDAQLVFV